MKFISIVASVAVHGLAWAAGQSRPVKAATEPPLLWMEFQPVTSSHTPLVHSSGGNEPRSLPKREPLSIQKPSATAHVAPPPSSESEWESEIITDSIPLVTPTDISPLTPATRNPDQTTTGAQANLDGYSSALFSALEQSKYYPPLARRLALQGTTLVRFAVDRQGQLVGAVQVIRSSGHEILDIQAIEIIRKVTPIGPLPQAWTAPRAEFTLPVRFSLAS